MKYIAFDNVGSSDNVVYEHISYEEALRQTLGMLGWIVVSEKEYQRIREQTNDKT